jgi:hypothetical protein
MRNWIVGSLVITAFSMPVLAQRMGSVNTNAPTVGQSIEFGKNQSVSIKYTAIHWAKGRTMGAVKDKERGERARNRINQEAEVSPLGSFTSTMDVMIAGQKVPAGDYSLYFTIDADLKWHMVLGAKGGQGKIDLTLDLKETQHESKRLVLGLGAGDEDGTASLHVMFGNQHAMFSVTGAGSKKAEDARGDKDAGGHKEGGK